MKDQSGPDEHAREQSAIELARKLADMVGEVLGRAETPGAAASTSVTIELQLNEGDATSPNVRVTLSRGTAPTALSPSEVEEPDRPAQLEFNSEGHHVVALIAARDLAARVPNVSRAVQRVLDAGNRTIQEAATFPDDIRSRQPQTRPFHFVDIPFEDGGSVNPPLPGAPHVVTKIEDFTAVLRSRDGSAESPVDALSWLFHLFGDVHQPLHCIERFSDLHPGGDRGGNSFRLSGRKSNLHSLWDSAVNVSAPLEEEEIADEIMAEHTRESLRRELEERDPEAWARASHALARKHAYSLREDPGNPPRPSAAYIRNMERIGRKQAALGGYRLADRLTEIFGTE